MKEGGIAKLSNFMCNLYLRVNLFSFELLPLTGGYFSVSYSYHFIFKILLSEDKVQFSDDKKKKIKKKIALPLSVTYKKSSVQRSSLFLFTIQKRGEGRMGLAFVSRF